MKKSLRVMIVEDEVMTAMWLEMELKKNKIDVIKRVTTGEEAVKFALKIPLDVILMDIGLPGNLDGIGAMKEIRKFEDIPVIFMSGYSENELIKFTKEIKPIQCITKPIRFNDIVTALENYF